MTICGWCDQVMPAVSPTTATGGVSHGLCRSCLDAALARAVARPAPKVPLLVVPPAAPAPIFARA